MKVFIFVLCIITFCVHLNKSSPINDNKTLNYRLNTDVEPLDYTIELTPHFDRSVNGREPFTFDGICTITIKASKSNVDTITLHKQDLNILEERLMSIDIISNNYNNETNKYTLKLASPLVKDKTYVLNFIFNAKLRTDLYGFYRSSYRDGNITK